MRTGLERFRFKCCDLKIMRSGIFLRKMPLGVYVSVKSPTGVADPRGMKRVSCL
jgi:hypothetical protein